MSYYSIASTSVNGAYEYIGKKLGPLVCIFSFYILEYNGFISFGL